MQRMQLVCVSGPPRLAQNHVILSHRQFPLPTIRPCENFRGSNDTPMGKMIFTVLGAVAELERNLIKERVQMGISRARKQGRRLGGP